MFTFYSPNLIINTDTLYMLTHDNSGGTDTTMTGYDFTPLIDRVTRETFDVTMPAAANQYIIMNYLPALVPGLSEQLADTLMIQNTNIKSGYISVGNGVSSSVLDITNSADGNIYFSFDELTVQSLAISIYSVTSGDDLNIGEIVLLNKQCEFSQSPNYLNYQPVITGWREEKTLTDGGSLTYNRDKKFQAQFHLDMVSDTQRQEIKDMYESIGSFYFAPYPTSSAWGGEAYEVNFIGDYNLDAPARNDTAVPLFRGDIIIKEVPK